MYISVKLYGMKKNCQNEVSYEVNVCFYSKLCLIVDFKSII